MTKLSFGQKLMILRKNKKVSQKKLAEELSIGIATVVRYENDSTVPTVDVLLKLSDYFDVSLDYILKDVQSTKIKDKEFLGLLEKADSLKDEDKNRIKMLIKSYVE